MKPKTRLFSIQLDPIDADIFDRLAKRERRTKAGLFREWLKAADKKSKREQELYNELCQ